MNLRQEWIKDITNGYFKDHKFSDKTITGLAIDSRLVLPGQLYVPLAGERVDGHAFAQEAAQKGASLILWQHDRGEVPRTINGPVLIVDNTLAAMQNLAKEYLTVKEIPVVAVTGSNGKTTTKELIKSLLAAKYVVHATRGNQNNEIGLPLTVLNMPEKVEMLVLELGMNHLGELSFLSQLVKPNFAVITNITEAHGGHIGSRERIAEAKLEIIAGLSEQGLLICDGDEPLFEYIPRLQPKQVKRVGWTEASEVYPSDIKREGNNGFSFTAFGSRFLLPMLGRYNIKNGLMALAVANELGVPISKLQAALGNFKHQLSNRFCLKSGQAGLKLIDDTYNTNPTAMKSALKSLMELDHTGERWALLGDMNELEQAKEEEYHQEVGKYAVQAGLKRLYTVGKKGAWIAAGARSLDSPCQIEHLPTVEQAQKILRREAREDVLLLLKGSRALELERVVETLELK
jgi:UDP-N-acetylmuramoyl-tripeptide--D-alanyl-D-alanine ligase